MSEQVVEMNLGKVLMAIIQSYGTITVAPELLLSEESLTDYQLRVEFNDETELFEITLEQSDES